MQSGAESLILKASNGDPVAIEQLLADNLPRLRAYIRLKAGQLITAKESCSDLVQSVCREVLEDLPSFEYRGEGPFRYWLLKHALNKVVDRARYYRADQRSPAHEVQVDDRPGDEDSTSRELVFATYLTPSRDAVAKEELCRLEAAFERLPPDYREAIFLHRIVGLSHSEIASNLGRTEGAVRNLLYRGLARLSLLMGERQ